MGGWVGGWVGWMGGRDGFGEAMRRAAACVDRERWVGGWVGWVKENEAVRMRYCELGGLGGGGWVGRRRTLGVGAGGFGGAGGGEESGWVGG